ncbi:GNAT family N-acetyltransferase [Actinoplanes regularis]|uniref:Acetyltransferase (GNAT) family protein n=1 Tax=Actinoplanes regularis TaxID=52697 RepID=A0A238XEU9_9ACTN|nr:GNAT family N-acetyltransferase [Actinoplanes regularis]GIE86759.1 N-acetyltransferase [Actinoplanes regularis]SNR57536.1 Acetyltransferase (GNAT) family protein [Actinoplanes regularis]
MGLTITRVDADGPEFSALVDLFDEYRVHYGETSDPGRTAAWLADQLGSGQLRACTAALADHPAVGFITSAVLPASLRLATFWLVRDLFVRPAHRGAGAARALLGHVTTEARAAGALRVSLQTELDNFPALALYSAAGFRPVDGLTSLSLPLLAQP